MTPQRLLSALLAMVPLMLAQNQPTAQNQPPPQHNLMPVPASLTFKDGRMPIDATFKVGIVGYSDDRLVHGVGRALHRLEGRIGLALSLDYSDIPAAKLTITCASPGKPVPALDEDESYTLEVDGQSAALKANTVVGALRGLETFLQLVSSDKAGYFLPAVSIQDVPRFAWRGLLIDVARHFEPVSVIKRNLDAMATVKLNVLHWHLTEDQGFRVESKRFPKLHEMGSDGLYYTQDQVRDVIAYARERGIRVVPEFDMPGHVQAWLVGHPELAAASGPFTISRRWGVMDATFDPTKKGLYEFLDGLLGEMAELFPDAYLHIGGDENNGKWWSANPNIVAFREAKGLKDNHALQNYFNQRVLHILEHHHKRMMGWDEILHPDLPKEVMAQSWQDTAALTATVKAGYDGILSAPYYIDRMQPASEHYVDPIPANSDLTAEQRKHVFGGEATMWSELVASETIDSRIWPRTAAIAEKLWSQPSVNDVDDMYRRLDRVSLQLEELGLEHRKNPNMLLRRMVVSDQIAPLQGLLTVVHPLRGYQRPRFQHPDAFTPLTRLVDAANADSADARRFSKQVDALLNDAPHFRANAAELKAEFARWKELDAAVEPVLSNTPVLQEAVPLAQDLVAMSTLGEEALKFLHSRKTPPAKWRTQALAQLQDIGKPKAAMESSVFAPLKELVFAATEISQLKDKKLTVEDWRARVKALANPKPARR